MFQVLDTNQDVSRQFEVVGKVHIILTGTPTQSWHVQLSLDDGATWQNDGIALTTTETSVIWEGSEEILFRINLGSGGGGAGIIGKVGGVRMQHYTGGLRP